MIALARGRFIRMSPRKIRMVLDLVRRKSVPDALAILDRAPRRAAGVVKKLLNQAVDAASKQRKLGPERLVISKTYADGAGMMKRFRAMSLGRAGMIRKRLSHVTIELDEVKGSLLKPAEAHPQEATKAAKPSAAGPSGVRGARKIVRKLAGAR